jgi:PilZ domain
MTDRLAVPPPDVTETSEAYLDTEIDRQFPRNDFRGHAEATIYPPAGQTAEPTRCTVLTRDLSNRGFGIAHNEPLRPQQRVELDTDNQRFVGEVLWCRQIRPEFYIIGCRLISAT